MPARRARSEDTPVLDLEACLLGGQAFTWRPAGDAFCGPLAGVWSTLSMRDGRLRAEGGSHGAVRRYLDLDGEPSACLSFDPLLAPLSRLHPGLRILRQDPWEGLLGFLASPVNNVPRIAGMLERLGRKARPIPGGYALPGPEAVARLGTAGLRRAGFGFRASRIAAAAREVASGRLDLERIARGPTPAARDAILALDGAGPKVAECVLAFALHKGDAFPVDRWVQRAVAAVAFAHEPDVGEAETMAWGLRRFGARAALAQQLLFHAARHGDIAGVQASPFRGGLPAGATAMGPAR